MSYAIILVQGKQYRVSEQDSLAVDRLDAKEGEVITLDQVLLYADGQDVLVGTPTLPGYSVSAKVTSLSRGKKIRVATYKAKSRSRRVVGHRQDLTELLIQKLNTKSPSKPTKPANTNSSPKAKPATKSEGKVSAK